jgi:hypothetical protein
MTPLEVAGLLAVVAWNLATDALVPVTVGLSFWRVMMVTQAATAVANTVPTVGPAIGTGLTYRMLGSWGSPGRGRPPPCWSPESGIALSSWTCQC